MRVLVLEDNPVDAELIQFEMEEAGLTFTTKVVRTEKAYVRELIEFPPDLILSAYNLPLYNGTLALAEARKRCPDTPFILVSGTVKEALVIDLLTQGAKDYIPKNHLHERLVPVVRRAWAEVEEIRMRKKAEVDLTEAHRRLEEQIQEKTAELLESRERLSLALASSGMGAFDWDLVTGKRYWDDTLHRLLGIEQETFTGAQEEFFQVIHPGDRHVVQEALDKAIGKGVPYRIEYRVIWQDGSIRHIATRGKVLRDDAGRPVRLSGVSWDTTDRKKAEEEREKLQAQLLQAQKMESVGRLAGGVAHDFNNMLGVILGHAEMALEEVEPTTPLHMNLREIRDAAQRSADLTRQLLAFARKQTISPKVQNLNDTVGGMLRMLGRLIGEDILLLWQPGADLGQICVDPSQIDQILANLCINARDAIAGVGEITIETANISLDEAYCADHAGFSPGEHVLLTVSDNGCGMDKETLDHLFEPFFTTKGMGKGTGLGMATVYGIVKQNKGFINVYSEPAYGTTFRIYLPRHAGVVEQARIEAPPKPAPSCKETILVVEDELEILDISRRMLERQGYRVLTAGSPAKALELVKNHDGEIHLLLSDVIMPGMNGRDLAQQMLSPFPDMKRLFMSGYTANIIAHHGVLDEGVHFIQKPFSMKNLTAKVRQILDQS